jgi:hypothetical protein
MQVSLRPQLRYGIRLIELNAMMVHKPQIEIEREFAKVVRKIGGELIDDLLSSDSRRPENADYLFRTYNVVAELKCLQKNSILDPDFLDKLGRLYGKLMREGRAPIVRGFGTVSLQQMAKWDERAVYEFIEPYKKRLGRIMHKANSQIEKTAKHFGVQNPRGLLLLANEGDLAYELGLLQPLLTIPRPQNSAINSVLYFTENVTVNVPGYHPAASVWMPMTMHGRAAVDPALLGRLRDAWMNRVATLRGKPIIARMVGEKDQIDIAQILFTGGQRPKLNIG